MELTHDFTVPASMQATWAAFTDIGSVAGCFPGATVTDVDGDAFEGSCKVKLGPIALVYNGSGEITEKDEPAGRLVIDAKGKDKRGNGTAGAHVVATLTAAGDGTRVSVATDLAITGKPAQFGRGVMQDVSDKLLAQFVDCLAQRLSESEPAAQSAPEPAPGEGTTVVSAGRPASVPPPQPEATQTEAIDLGATVLPVLARTYWRHGVAVLAVLVLVRALLRRRR